MSAYEKRLEIISRYHPELARRLKSVTPQKWKVVEGPEGINLECGGVRFHGADPFGEVASALPPEDFKDEAQIYHLGLGLGYICRAALPWLKRAPKSRLIVFEPDLEVLYHFLQQDFATEILNHPQILIESLTSNEMKSRLGKHLFSSLFYDETLVFPPSISSANYYKRDPSRVHAFHGNLHQILSQLRYDIEYLGPPVVEKNYTYNLRALPGNYHMKPLKGLFKDVPMVFCGAAPSLANEVEFLKKAAQRSLIVSGSTGLNALQSFGIRPHMIVGSDPMRNLFSKFADYFEFDIPFFYNARIQHELLDYHGGPLVYTYDQGSQIGTPLLRALDLGAPIPDLPMEYTFGHSVTSFSIILALYLGCPEVHLVGVDYSYEKGVKRYTIDHPQHPVVGLHSTAAPPPMTTYQVKRASDSKIHEVTGEFHVEVEWLEKFVLSKKRPKISFGSKIGAEISGLSWQDSLEKYAEWPAKPDIEKRLFEALERGGENALPHRQLFAELKKIKEKIEIVYSYLLEALQKIQEIDRCRDTLTKRLLLTESARLLGRVFETDEYRFYLRIRDLHWREVMNYFYLYWKRGQRMEEKERFVSIAKALLKSVAAEWVSIAKMLNGGLLLGKTFKGEPAVRARAPDPEGLHYADGSFYSDKRVSDGVQSIYYPSGKLKAEIPFRMGKLDGTVQLYFPDGTIKRSIGFKEGKKEGIERAFATDGTLLLEATFREDKPLGKAFYCDVRDGIGLKALFDEKGKVLEVEEW